VATNPVAQISNMKTSPAIANKGDHSMPTLQNPRHERFAQESATGKTADAAYVLAGYRANRSHAARLSANQDIQRRVAEIQSLGAERAAITVETLIAEAEAARSKAMSEKGGAAAAVAAITAKAKLAGRAYLLLWMFGSPPAAWGGRGPLWKVVGRGPEGRRDIARATFHNSSSGSFAQSFIPSMAMARVKSAPLHKYGGDIRCNRMHLIRDPGPTTFG
jgi:phage terminase small subunit